MMKLAGCQGTFLLLVAFVNVGAATTQAPSASQSLAPTPGSLSPTIGPSQRPSLRPSFGPTSALSTSSPSPGPPTFPTVHASEAPTASSFAPTLTPTSTPWTQIRASRTVIVVLIAIFSLIIVGGGAYAYLDIKRMKDDYFSASSGEVEIRPVEAMNPVHVRNSSGSGKGGGAAVRRSAGGGAAADLDVGGKVREVLPESFPGPSGEGPGEGEEF